MARVFVFGLDCASPELILERWRDELPSLSSLLDGATFGPLRSVHPPITIPAWASMLTGRDPGELGIYGFRDRPERERGRPRLHDSASVRAPALWDLAAAEGLDSIVVGFPPSYPASPVRGCLVTCMLTPEGSSRYTWPPELGEEIERWVGPYRFDVEGHRDADAEALCASASEMTRVRFAVARRLAMTRPWSFFFVHEIGLDRVQHALWDGLADPGSEAERALLAYHRLLDAEIGETLAALPDETVVLVASDHGARALRGSFCVNEWLRSEGYLSLLPGTPPPGAAPAALDLALVDWERTRAWADGGYCGRIWLSGVERDERGALASRDARALRDEIRGALEALPGPDGEPLASSVQLPEQVYARVEGTAPDLLFYPGDLDYRCAATVGHGRLFLDENDTGRDVANHDWDGLFVLRDPDRPGRGRVEGAHLLDVAPTLAARLEVPVPGSMRGGTLA